MGYAKYVGRIGALAVALGIGTALITTPGMAWADGDTTSNANGDATHESPKDANTPNVDDHQAPGTHVGTDPDQGPTTGSGTTTNTGSGTTTGSSIGLTDGPKVTLNAQTTTTTTTTTTNTTTTPTATPTPTSTPTVDPIPTSIAPTTDPVVTPGPSTPEQTPTLEPTPTPTPTATPTLEPTESRIEPTLTSTEADPTVITTEAEPTEAPGLLSYSRQRSFAIDPSGQPDDGTADFRASAFAAGEVDPTVDPTAPIVLPPPAVTTPPVNPIAALIALPGNLIQFAVDLISAVLSPLMGTGPSVPADTPVLWAVLAFVRRQFFNTSATLAPTGQTADPTTGQLYGGLGAVDADGDPLTYRVIQGPAHGEISLDASGGYVYKPTAGYVGADSFTVGVSDAGPHVHGLSGLFSQYGPHTTVATIALTAIPVVAAPVNTAPKISAVPVVTNPATGATRYTVTTIDTPGDTVLVTHTDPLHGTLVADPTDPTVFDYTPNADYAHQLHLGGATAPGTDEITFTATDSKGATGTVTVKPSIVATNATPTVTVTSTPTGAADGTVLLTITYADTDGDTLRLDSKALKYGYFTDKVGGAPFYSGDTSFDVPGSTTGAPLQTYYVPDPAHPGEEVITYSFTDAYGGTATDSVRIAAPVNTAPKISAVPVVTNPATGATRYTVTTIDTPGDTVLVTHTDPLHGTLVADPTDPTVFDYTPNADYAHQLHLGGATAPGTDEITFTATDSKGATGTVTVKPSIVATNATPTVTVTSTPTGAADGTVLLTITYADTDGDTLRLDSKALKYGYFTDKVGGAPFYSGDTSFDVPGSTTGAPLQTYYVPDPAHPGEEVITYSFTDAYGGTATDSVRIADAAISV